MTHDFDKPYWERHWQGRPDGDASMATNPPNPHLVRETGGLAPGTALDAGCGAGAEAIWLASRGWQVTGADISAEALAQAAARAAVHEVADRVRWVEADLGTWEPDRQFDLVTTHYAHPAMPQLAFYDRLAGWVAPGGTLLVVGHLAHSDGPEGQARGQGQGQGHGPGRPQEHGHEPPAEATATAAAITARLDGSRWTVVTAAEPVRTLGGHEGRTAELHDVVVRAVRHG